MNPIGLKFMIEKREGHGEDSDPLSIVKDNFCAVGVFDGMGGSGAAICKSDFGDNHTKAYVASRITLDAINDYMRNTKNVQDISLEGIKNTIRGRLEQEKANYPTKASGLRSKLVRDYPTTLAITTALKNEDGTHAVNSYWAGDSRNYLWTAEGFYQISKDDLDTELDPLENLRDDGALSNCICADREFEINNKTIPLKGKFVILSATDGCFNYFASPMHFNEVLVTGLKQSDSVEDWENFCKSEISAVTGDDVSISLLAIGFEDFKDLKESFSNMSVANIDEIKKAKDNLESLDKQIKDCKNTLENLIQKGWDEYKVSYMKYFNSDDAHLEAPSKGADKEESEASTENTDEALDTNRSDTEKEEDSKDFSTISKEYVSPENVNHSPEKSETPIETENVNICNIEHNDEEKDVRATASNMDNRYNEVP